MLFVLIFQIFKKDMSIYDRYIKGCQVMLQGPFKTIYIYKFNVHKIRCKLQEFRYKGLCVLAGLFAGVDKF